MMTANRCSTLESLTWPLSPFALREAAVPRYYQRGRESCVKNFPSGGAFVRSGQTSDRDRGSVKLGDGKAFKILPDIVVVALVAKNADGHRLAQPQLPLEIRPPMNPREVARLPDI